MFIAKKQTAREMENLSLIISLIGVLVAPVSAVLAVKVSVAVLAARYEIMMDELKSLRQDLRELEKRGSYNHNDIVSLRERISFFQKDTEKGK